MEKLEPSSQRLRI